MGINETPQRLMPVAKKNGERLLEIPRGDHIKVSNLKKGMMDHQIPFWTYPIWVKAPKNPLMRNQMRMIPQKNRKLTVMKNK